MFTQDLTVAYMCESVHNKEVLAEAQERCHVRQLLGMRPIKPPAHLPAVLLNMFLLTATLLRKH